MGNTGSGKGGTFGESQSGENINIDKLDEAIRSCMAICKAIFNHAVEMGFTGSQAMILATTYMRAVLVECSGR